MFLRLILKPDRFAKDNFFKLFSGVLIGCMVGFLYIVNFYGV